jgi:methionine-rich copper-binding protein CopC
MHNTPSLRSVVRAVTLSVVGITGLVSLAQAAVHRPLPGVLHHPFHLRLQKSAPAKGEVLLAAPKVVQLWFSLPPEMAVTAIKLAAADGKAITVSAPRRGTGAKDPVEADIKQALAAGSYTVSWKTSSKDGHPITGDFAFTVKSAAN